VRWKKHMEEFAHIRSLVQVGALPYGKTLEESAYEP
jgi:hypothetical protein